MLVEPRASLLLGWRLFLGGRGVIGAGAVEVAFDVRVEPEAVREERPDRGEHLL